MNFQNCIFQNKNSFTSTYIFKLLDMFPPYLVTQGNMSVNPITVLVLAHCRIRGSKV